MYNFFFVIYTIYMKFVKSLGLCLCFMAVILCSGCGEKELSSANVFRDDARTGGTLSFVYDKDDRVIYIGGEDEYIQYSSADEERGLSAGNRVGLKVVAPDEKLDLNESRLEMNKVVYSGGSFLESENGEKQRFFVIKPLFSDKVREVSFKVCWQDGTKEQTYKVVVKDGTKFLEKE